MHWINLESRGSAKEHFLQVYLENGQILSEKNIFRVFNITILCKTTQPLTNQHGLKELVKRSHKDIYLQNELESSQIPSEKKTFYSFHYSQGTFLHNYLEIGQIFKRFYHSNIRQTAHQGGFSTYQNSLKQSDSLTRNISTKLFGNRT